MKHKVRVLFAAALVLSALVYIQALSYGFVYDDIPLIAENPLIREVRNIPALVQQEDMLDGFHTGYYRPLIPLFYMMDYQLWGLRPFGYHVSNLLLHLCAVALIFFLSLTLLQNPWGAFVSGVFFGLHPVNTEAVTFLTGRNNIVCAVFILSSVLAYMKFREQERRGWLVLSTLSFLGALLSKEFAVILPAALIGVDIAQGRFQKKSVPRYLPFFAVLALYAALRSVVIHSVIGVRVPAEELPQRIAGALDIVTTYLRLSFIPFAQKALYDVKPASPLKVFLEALFLIGLAVAAYRQRKKGWVMFSAVWFFGFLAPVMNILPVSGSIVAERYVYVPLAGIALFAGGLATSVPGGRGAQAVKAALALLLCMFGILTVLRNPVWRNEEALYRDMVRTTPSSYKGYYNLGNVLYRQGELDEARTLWEKVIEIRPDMMAVHNNLGVLFEKTGEYGRAEEHYRAVLGVRPMPEVYQNLGNALSKQGRGIEAVEAYRKAISLSPKSFSPYLGLLTYYESRGKQSLAFETALRAIENIPDSYDAYNTAGTILGNMKRYHEAYRYFQKAVELNPNCYECMHNLNLVKDMMVAGAQKPRETTSHRR